MSVSEALSASGISVVVVFDDDSHRRDLKVSWGFSCVVRGAEKAILFDTGDDGAILMGNMAKLKIDPETIDVVVLSHAHGDHTGGLKRFLAANSGVAVYLPKSFPEAIKATVRRYGAEPVEVGDPVRICAGVWSTGETGTDIVEQALVAHTDKGSIVITGCAHPGIVKIVEKARKLTGNRGVLLAMGGFHLRGENERTLRKIIASFRRLGVSKVCPCHCSGNRARELFRERYGSDYIISVAGTSVRLDG
jgi:7,8-dihydropterin-6-yl-methyl-4-(beta-D-ribofuranosyl)aminobenzene 5'-phosphate synthase